MIVGGEKKEMARHKMCPRCGSRNINFLDNPKKCHNCGHTWTTDPKRHRTGAKKDNAS
jgi:ribosomal protein L37E